MKTLPSGKPSKATGSGLPPSPWPKAPCSLKHPAMARNSLPNSIKGSRMKHLAGLGLAMPTVLGKVSLQSRERGYFRTAVLPEAGGAITLGTDPQRLPVPPAAQGSHRLTSLQPHCEPANSKSVNIVPGETKRSFAPWAPKPQARGSELPTRDSLPWPPHGRLSFLDLAAPMEGLASWTTGRVETSQPEQTLAMPSSSLVRAAARPASSTSPCLSSLHSEYIALSRFENPINGW